MSKEDQEFARSFTFNFYGDLQLDSIPTTLEEAVQVCKIIPKQLTKTGGIPQIITLLPLVNYSPGAASVKQVVREAVMQKVVFMLETLLDIKKSSEIIEDLAGEHGVFLSISNVQKAFGQELVTYVASVRDDLKDKLPRIRSGERQHLLMDVVIQNEKTPFAVDRLGKWQNDRESEIKEIVEYLQSLPDIKVCKTEADFNEMIKNPKYGTVYCLTIEHYSWEEQLEDWKKYNFDHAPGVSLSIEVDKKTAVEVIKKYKEFFNAKKGPKIGFGAFEKLTKTDLIRASVQQYKNGVCIDQNVDMKVPPPPPPSPPSDDCTII